MRNRLDLREIATNKKTYYRKFNLLTSLCRNSFRLTLLN